MGVLNHFLVFSGAALIGNQESVSLAVLGGSLGPFLRKVGHPFMRRPLVALCALFSWYKTGARWKNTCNRVHCTWRTLRPR